MEREQVIACTAGSNLLFDRAKDGIHLPKVW
jgi:hypothetical protein